MELNNSNQNTLGDEKVFSISEYIKILNKKLAVCAAKIIGEVSEVKTGPTGHVYFSLKDEKGEAMINCVIWKSRYSAYGIELKKGLKIAVFGQPKIYAPWGKFSFYAETIELAGEGALKKAYDALKKKLELEGIFAEEKKRKIPAYPRKIGLITSKQGAVLSDFLNNLGKFGFKIKMIDSRVEGQSAVTDLLSSVRSFKKEDIDVLVIIRGGGSLESIIAFNNETLVREIAGFPVPVIAGIGHDKDIPLVALASDIMVSTPTAVANLLSQSWEQATSLTERYEARIFGSYENALVNVKLLLGQSADSICQLKDFIINKHREAEMKLKILFQKFNHILQNTKINLRDSWNKSIISGFNSLLSAKNREMEYAQKVASLNNPERQLRLGYAIARCHGKMIRSVRDAKSGENMDLRVMDGIIISKITKTKNE